MVNCLEVNYLEEHLLTFAFCKGEFRSSYFLQKAALSKYLV